MGKYSPYFFFIFSPSSFKLKNPNIPHVKLYDINLLHVLVPNQIGEESEGCLQEEWLFFVDR